MLKRIVFLGVMGWWGVGVVSADRIHLTNGQVLEGLVVEEGADKVTFSMGGGTMQLPRDRVARIELEDGADRNRMEQDMLDRNRLHPDNVPEKFQRLYKDYMAMNADARKMRVVFRSLPHLATDIKTARTNYGKKQAEVQQKRARLARMKVNADVVAYNQAVDEYNKLWTKLPTYEARITQLERSFWQKTNQVNTFGRRCVEFDMRMAKEILSQRASEEDRAFLQAVHNKVGVWRDWFDMGPRIELAPADAKQGLGTVEVPVWFNDHKEPVRLVLDTGASVTTLSGTAARKLGLDTRKGVGRMFSMANGQAVYGRVITVDRMRVGKHVVEQVEVAILPSASSDDQDDGLLGMSFLHRFDVTLTADRKLKLVPKAAADSSKGDGAAVK